MQGNVQDFLNSLVPVFRKCEGLYSLLTIEYKECSGLAYAKFSTGVQKVVDVDGLSKAGMIQKILEEITEKHILPENRFREFMEKQRQEVERELGNGWSRLEILVQLTGAVGATAGTDRELSFTASQLNQIFNLPLDRNIEKEHPKVPGKA